MVSKFISSFVESLGFASQPQKSQDPPQDLDKTINQEDLKIPLDKLEQIKKIAKQKSQQEQIKSPLKTLQQSQSFKKVASNKSNDRLFSPSTVNNRKSSISKGITKREKPGQKVAQTSAAADQKSSNTQDSKKKVIEKCVSPKFSLKKLEQVESRPKPKLSGQNVAVIQQNDDVSDEEVPFEREQSSPEVPQIDASQQKSQRNNSTASIIQNTQRASQKLSFSDAVGKYNQNGRYSDLSLKNISNRDSKISSKITASTTPIKYEYNLKDEIKEVNNYEEESPRIQQKKIKQDYVHNTFHLTKMINYPKLISAKSQIVGESETQKDPLNNFSTCNDLNKVEVDQSQNFFPSSQSNFSYQPKFFKPSCTFLNNTCTTSQHERLGTMSKQESSKMILNDFPSKDLESDSGRPSSSIIFSHSLKNKVQNQKKKTYIAKIESRNTNQQLKQQ